MLEDNALTILIVEDDLSFAIELDMLVRSIGYQVLGRVDNASDALTTIERQTPDLILMDVEIKGAITGIELAQQIRHLDSSILFITSFSQKEYYNQAKETNFIGYLVKPIDKYSLRSTIELAVQSLKEKAVIQKTTFVRKNDLFFKKKGVYYKVLIKDILFIKADSDYTITYTEEGDFVSSIRLNDYLELLEGHTFIRIHRSYILNLDKASTLDYENNKINVQGHTLPFSRRIKSELLKNIRFVK